MRIEGLSKRDSSTLQNPRVCTMDKALSISKKSQKHYVAVLNYYSKKLELSKPGTIGHEMYQEYLNYVTNN